MKRLQCKYSREWIDFDIELTQSGEATIWKSSKKSGVLGKEYHAHLIKPEKIDKLDVMVNNPPADPTKKLGHISIAWPQDLLMDANGTFVGFLMPEIVNGKTLINVYNPRKRQQKGLQGFNWLYLHRTAQNLASAIQAVHAMKYAIGDIKSLNILVNDRALVSVIDTDSFQIFDRRTGKIYRCPVGTPEYTPSEMIGKKFGTVDISEFHDRFGLAVIIWQLLFGEHPFNGQWTGAGEYPPIQKQIEKGYWQYGSNSKVKPGKTSIPITVLHPQLQQYFRRCFDDGHTNPSARPSAADWIKALDTATKDLVNCSVEPGHYYAKSYGSCYWCERKRQLNYDIFATPGHSFQIPIIPTFLQQPLPRQTPYSPSQKPQKITYLTSFKQNLNRYLPKLISLPTKFSKPKTVWLGAGLVFLLGLGGYWNWQSQFDTSGFQKIVLQENLSQSKKKLTPRQTIEKYYELAPSNKQAAVELLSQSLKSIYKQIDDKSFWNSINKVEIYAIKTIKQSENQTILEAWLKYFLKDGTTACESRFFELVFDKSQSQWLFNNTYEVTQKPECKI